MEDLQTRVSLLEELLYNTNVVMKEGADIDLVRDQDTRAAIARLEAKVDDELLERRRGREAAAAHRRLTRSHSRNIPFHTRDPETDAEG